METDHGPSIMPQLQGHMGWIIQPGPSIVVTIAATNGNSDMNALEYSFRVIYQISQKFTMAAER